MAPVAADMVKVDVSTPLIAYDRDRVQTLYCLVFPAEIKNVEASEVAERRQVVLDKIVEAGLSVSLFYSVQEDEIFCTVGASDTRLLLEADAREYKLGLEPGSMRILAVGDKDPKRRPIYLESPFHGDGRFKVKHSDGTWNNLTDLEVERHLSKRTPFSPFEQLFAPYSEEWETEGQEMYKVQVYKTYDGGAILRNADRMKLCRMIMEHSSSASSSTSVRGAGLNLAMLQQSKDLIGEFPLQSAQTSFNANELTVDELYSKWASTALTPWRQPLQEVRDYFGEKIAMYFAFLGHYTLWLCAPAFIGLAIFVHQLYNVNINGVSFFNPAVLQNNTAGDVWTAVVYTEMPESPYFAVFMAIWATLLMEFWKRKQARHALKWGMVGFESNEQARVEFKPTHFLPSPVTGEAESYQSENGFIFKLTSSLVVLFFCISVVCAAIGAILILKVAVTQAPEYGIDETTGPQLALVVNAISIQVLGAVYKTIAKKLNDWENHRTDTAYEDALIAKSSTFNIVNSYATLTYVAFVKSGTDILGVTQYCIVQAGDVDTSAVVEAGDTVADACFGGLGMSLFIIFGSQLVINNTLEVVLPTVTSFMKRRANLKGVVSGIKDVTGMGSSSEVQLEAGMRLSAKLEQIPTRSPAEDQFFLKTYEGTFADFLEIALQFGMTTLFVVAFPLAPFLALVNNFVEIRVDSFKLCKLSRRPEMQSAEDIGTWYNIFSLLGSLAVVTNAGVVCFTSSGLLPDIPFLGDSIRVWFFILFVMVVTGFKWLVGYLVADIPGEVQIQIQRNEFIVRKCLIGERDEDDSDLGKKLHIAERQVYHVSKCDPAVLNLLRLVANNIEEHAMGASMEEQFHLADADGSGEITTQELATILKKTGGIGAKIVESEIEMLVHALDYNGNKKIDYAEFQMLFQASDGNNQTSTSTVMGKASFSGVENVKHSSKRSSKRSSKKNSKRASKSTDEE